MNNCTGAIEYGDVVYFSHLIPIFISLTLSLSVLFKSKLSRLSLHFFIFTSLSCLWLVLDTVTWISTDYFTIILSWIPLDLVSVLFFISAMHFLRCLSDSNTYTKRQSVFDLILISPFVLSILFKKSIVGFDINSCEVIDNTEIIAYKFIVEAIIILRIVIMSKIGWYKKGISIVTIAILAFLISFSITGLVSSLTGIYEINMYSLFILPISLFIVIFSVIDFNTFSLRTDSQKIVVYILILLAMVQMFFIRKDNYLIDIVNIVLYLSLGKLLMKSINNEIASTKNITIRLDRTDKLNSNLNQIILDQTSEIRHAYEMEKKSKRELEKLSETKDKFINIIQHNLRVPITRISNELSKLNNSNKEINTKDVNSQINHLRRVADDLKDISKIQLGSQILNLSSSSVLPLLEEVIDELRIDILKSNITVFLPIEDIHWPKINIDQNKIKEVLFVVIENAIRYNKKDGTIEIKTDGKQDYFTIEISNTGIGISNTEINKLFDRTFYRSDRAREINPTGMGIGLYVSRSIIEAHHGNLDIYPDSNNIVTVSISIPYDFLKESLS